ncbi:peptidoglycan DD-metalloendopeptidase family protein [Patescibacteria group bacterium]
MNIYQKFFRIALGGILFFTFTSISFADDFFTDQDVWQGTAVDIKVPQYNYDSVEVFMDGAKIDFYNYVAQPQYDEPISRAEFLKLMFDNFNFGDVDVSEVPHFPDVETDHPYYDYIAKASSLDIVHGYEDGLFHPNATITRGQISKVLIRAFSPELKLGIAPRFSDVPSDHVFYAYIDEAVRAEIFQGYPDGLMRPDREINISEAEVVVQRAGDLIEPVKVHPREYFRGLIGIHRTKDSGSKNIHMKFYEDGQVDNEQFFTLNIIERSYPVQRFSIPSSKMALFDDDSMNKTWEMIDAAKEVSVQDQIWEGAFIIPTDGRETLGFGDIIYINGVYSGSHFGNDYANVEGTAIYASNKGVVKLSDYTPSYGNTVILDHGQNVFTMYIHMSALKSSVGDVVNQGDLIGLMGTTGISSGSHLHFTFFVDDVVVDSKEWYEGKY